MSRFTVSAPGKLHLLGEHVVVHDKPAILAAVDKRCFVEIVPRKDGKIKIKSKNYKKEATFSFEDLPEKFEKAKIDWESYNENNDISLLKSITKDPLDYPQIIIGQFLNYYKIESIAGFDLTIDSQVPVGCGMGSSGSLAVATIGALSLFMGKPFDKRIINNIAFLAEQKKHGKPSGGDNSTSCYGGLIWFKKGQGIKTLGLEVSPRASKNFYIINTGTPKETTGEMVSFVRNQILKNKKQKKTFERIFDDQEKLVHALLPGLEKAKDSQIIKIIRKGEVNLEKLGVVSTFVKNLIREIEESGGAAKICGAGGIKKSTGIVLIYHKNLKMLEKVLKSHKLSVSKVKLGAEGLRIE